jgi:hypothetical protein
MATVGESPSYNFFSLALRIGSNSYTHLDPLSLLELTHLGILAPCEDEINPKKAERPDS